MESFWNGSLICTVIDATMSFIGSCVHLTCRSKGTTLLQITAYSRSSSTSVQLLLKCERKPSKSWISAAHSNWCQLLSYRVLSTVENNRENMSNHWISARAVIGVNVNVIEHWVSLVDLGLRAELTNLTCTVQQLSLCARVLFGIFGISQFL